VTETPGGPLRYSKKELKALEAARSWAGANGMGFTALSRVPRADAPFPPNDAMRDDIAAAGARTRSERNRAIADSIKADFDSDLNAFHVMHGRRGDLQVSVQQFGATAGAPALAVRGGEANRIPPAWEPEACYSVSAAVWGPVPYLACGPSRTVRNWASRPELGPVEFADGRLGKGLAACAADARLAETVLTHDAVSRLRASDGFKRTMFILHGRRCHLVRFGHLNVEMLDGLLDLLADLHRLLPDRLR
jgi:hypothetical protein